MRAAIFITILVLLLSYTVYKAQNLMPHNKIWASVLGVVIFGVMIAWQVVYRFDTGMVYTTGYSILSWTGAIVMGLWASFVIFSLIGDFVHLLFWLSDKIFPAPVLNPERRKLLAQVLPMGILGASAISTAIGSTQGLTGPNVVEVEVPIKDLPPDLQGFTIAQISDLHVGPNIGKEYSERVVKLTNQLNADIIAITGDLVDGHPQDLAPGIDPLAQLKSKYGVYYVTGNHEYYWGGDQWVKKCEQIGFIPLLNEHRILKINSSKLLVGGIPDIQGATFIPEHAQDYNKAAGTEQVDFKLLLSHRPEVYEKAHQHGFQLVLAGHTHAGQFFPWSILVSLAYKYYRGLNKYNDTWIYVNAGTGYWGPMNRFTVPSEITLIRLKSA